MYSFGIVMIVVALFMVILFCLVCYVYSKERMDIIRKAKAMKAGDLYKHVYLAPRNPFIEPIIIQAKISAVKFDASGEPWVRYYEINQSPYACYDKVSNFLSKYQPVNQGDEK